MNVITTCPQCGRLWSLPPEGPCPRCVPGLSSRLVVFGYLPLRPYETDAPGEPIQPEDLPDPIFSLKEGVGYAESIRLPEDPEGERAAQNARVRGAIELASSILEELGDILRHMQTQTHE